MANNNNEGADNTPDNSKDEASEKSFVGKFMTGIIKSTPLSKWFGKEAPSRSVIRRREEDEELDNSFGFQPPSKRAKLPIDVEHNNYSSHIFESPVTVHIPNNVNNISSKVVGKFPEPVPGPSGYKTRKLFEKHSSSSTNTISAESFENQFDVINGDHDSDSGESTSGYSSAPKLLEKQKSGGSTSNNETCERVVPKARSLFTSPNDSSGGRTLFSDASQMNTSLSSRRPTFTSTFGSPNFIDRTLSTKKIMNSPFYNGRTIYGGASAYGRQLGRNSDNVTVARSSVQIKPINETSSSDNTTLSKTARRILNTLEQYSTPISDAKKIPVSPSSPRKPGLLSAYIGVTPYLVRDRKRPSHNELQVPSVPDLLRMKQKERLQTSTETVRLIATKSKSDLNKEEYKLRADEDTKQKHSNKMKSSVASTRQKVKPIEPVEEVKLPKVSLPITTLPKFDFVLMPPNQSSETKKDTPESCKSANSAKSPISNVFKPAVIVEPKETESKAAGNVKTSDYTFSKPLVILKDVKPVAPINCFKFSKPLSTKGTDTMFKAGDTTLKAIKPKNNGDSTPAKPANKLMTGSVMDFFAKNKDSPSQKKVFSKKTTWECPTCLVKNEADNTKCCACDEPKPIESGSQGAKQFGDQFKISNDKWECSSCLVRNNNSDKKCVACTAAKPGAESQTPKSGFGDKFKPPASTWECSSCLIRNKNELEKCAACDTAKVVKGAVASSFGDKFKPGSDTWECSACMIRNKNSVDKCVACETAKPGCKATPAPKAVSFNASGTTFSFGIKSEWECKTCMIKNKNELTKCAACEMPRDGGNTDKIGFGNTFKKKIGEWECTSCMVKNKDTVDVCVCCGVNKPGTTSKKLAELNDEKKPVNKFNFGIVGVTNSSTIASIPPTFSFVTTTTSSTSSSTFTFGINTQEKVESTKAITSKSESGTPIISTNPLLKPNEKLPEKAVPAPAGFKFGLDSSSIKKQPSENIANSKQETKSLSTSFRSTSVPTFQFKPATVNGDINKLKETTFSGDSIKSFVGETSKPKETAFIANAPAKESPFVKSQKPNESPFTQKSADSPFSGKPSESPFGTLSKPTDSPFGTTSKADSSPFVSTNTSPASSFTKKPDSPFTTVSRSVDSPFGTGTKSADSPFGATTKSAELQFGAVNKPNESPFRNVNTAAETPFGKPNETISSPFGKSSEPANSPFGKPKESAKSPFGMMSKPTESPFAADVTKSKESPFGMANNVGKTSAPIFGNVNETKKPSESLFGNDPNKSKEVIFGSKAPTSSNLFGAPSSTTAFNFTPKPLENTTTAFNPSPATSQSAAAGLFKFGGDASQTSVKRTLGDAPENNISNGFGSAAKIPAFGSPQSFGSSENKPFSFGSAETNKNPGFAFSQADKPSGPGAVFSFGSAASSTAAPSGGFNFSVPNTGFNFGSAPKVDGQPFNAPPNNNVFGPGAAAAKNGTFNFGTNANNNNQKAVFSFGANPSSQPSQSSFPSQPQAGFNFGGPTPALAVPPAGSFNVPSFTEGAATQGGPRRFKKAVRRTTTPR